jgi:hypothetical protein
MWEAVSFDHEEVVLGKTLFCYYTVVEKSGGVRNVE